MRLTEMISFLHKNPSADDVYFYTHVDVSDLKNKMKTDKEFSRFVRRNRKEWKKQNEEKNI